jgi:hypothetical protein
MDYRHDAYHITEDLVWKLAYYVFRDEHDDCKVFLTLPRADRESAWRRAFEACSAYAYARKFDDEFAPLSASFFLEFSRFIAVVGHCRQRRRTDYVFPDGAPRIAARVAYCLLRYGSLDIDLAASFFDAVWIEEQGQQGPFQALQCSLFLIEE